MSSPRVRFAPSPTGYLHVGGARTALFNWLYARHNGGTFVLRIEDTDLERSSAEMVTGILDGMRWLGLDWDEGPEVGGAHGPYFQSERLERYRSAAESLVASGHAYYCYCSPEELKAKRAAAEAAGGDAAAAWQYDRTCANLPASEIARREAAAMPRAIRFRMPPGTTAYDDVVHGRIEFDNAVIEDFVVLRSDRHPTYHLSVVVDDIDMRITDIVRGDDHISNTPKQVLLYQAFDAALPRFAHVPLILGPDKRRLSKRHGATSVMEYARQGFLPEAMFNFLALLGWSPGDDREFFTRGELIEAFTLEGISSSNAVFNPEKLDWFNSQHLARLSGDELTGRLEPLLRERGWWRESLRGPERPWFHQVLEVLKPRARKVADLVEQGRYFFEAPTGYDAGAVKKHLSDPALAGPLLAWREAILAVEPFDPPSIEQALRATAAARGVKAAALIHATRIALTGQAVSPSLFEVAALVGREASATRIEALHRFLEAGK
ncbi:MAG TPA: glutamate--tRNA ligase [Vicinamibacterales bacterium]|nr:glutamate--tRNA ligase [Acidobacteriota bacterium]HOC17356.1 glutamate--tRNA ligase [Vicinamibacterales bacterium]